MKRHRMRVTAITISLVATTSLILSAIASDFDGNGRVDFNDFLLFAAEYTRADSDPGFDDRFDLDGSRRIDFGDFLIFAQAFGQSDPVANSLADQQKDVRTRAEVDSIGRRVLDEYGDSVLAVAGILDVTKPPYNADNTGSEDVTAILQHALLDARDARLVCYLPEGTYRVSDTLEGIQGHINSQGDPYNEFRLRNDDYPCVIRGSRTGTTTLVLAAGSPGFNDQESPKPVIFLSSRRWVEPHDLQPNVSFDQMVIDLSFDLGGNAGAFAVDLQSAQGSVIENVHVEATGAFSGFRGLPGSGGSMANLFVTGGRYGFYVKGIGTLASFSGAQPSPVIASVTLTGQTERAVHYEGRGPLTIVGGRISGAGLRAEHGDWAPWNSGLNLVDTHITVQGGAAVTANRPVVMSNVYIEGSDTLAAIDDGSVILSEDASGGHVITAALTPGDSYPIWLDGIPSTDPYSSIEPITEPPPSDLQSRHLWPSEMPWYGESGVISVKDEAFGAIGDGVTDDTQALQTAIDAGGDVFIPKGVYKISSPLILGSNVNLFGVGNSYSVLSPITDAPAFADPSNPSPLIDTADDAAGTSTLSFLKLHSFAPGASALRWRLGRSSVVRSVKFKRWPPIVGGDSEHPDVTITGSGGGRWYTLYAGSTFDQAPGYRHFLVQGTREPLSFYMYNPEHGVGDYQSEFDDVQNVSIYGMKAETIGAGGQGAKIALYVHDSQNVRIFGYAGNASADTGSSLLRFSFCSDFLLANVAPQHVSFGQPPDTWFSLVDDRPTGAPVSTPATEWFALYRRGNP